MYTAERTTDDVSNSITAMEDDCPGPLHIQAEITVDYYSDFWEVDLLPNTSSETVIEYTKAHFAKYGIPEIVLTDNGPRFWSQEYETFAAMWEFCHTTSSPYHNQSNSKVESVVKIAKKTDGQG